MKRFGRREWDAYWLSKHRIEDVYSNRDRIVRRLAANAELKGTRILEVGAGSGRDALALAELGATVFLLDFSSAALLGIQERDTSGRAFVVCGDTTALPFRQETLDIVFSQGLLEHLADPERFLAECTRVLRKGGLFLVDVPQTLHPYTAAKRLLQAMGKWFAGWETQYTMRTLSRLVEEAGFVVVARYGDWMVPSFLYRSLRYVCQTLGLIDLPLYPKRPPLITSIARAVHGLLDNSWLQIHTAASIGVIGRKSPGSSPSNPRSGKTKLLHHRENGPVL